MMTAKPEVIRLMPTISPRAQAAVLGQPLMISENQVRDSACQHPTPGVGEHLAITEGRNDLEEAFYDEEANKHQGERDRAFGWMPEQQDADEQRECCRKQ